MTAEQKPTANRAAGSRKGPRVLVLNHRREPCGDLIDGLRNAGIDAMESPSMADTQRLIDATDSATTATTEPPDVLILNPLALVEGGVEAELLRRLQQDGLPQPVIFLVEDLAMLDDAAQLQLPFSDFVMKPHTPDELVRRTELAIRALEEVRRLHRVALDLEGQVSVDFKTGLLSERHFRHVLQAEFNRAQRHQLPLSLVLVDVDNFKVVNDTTEYAFGDKVLREVAHVLREGTRESDYAARFGGDEFVLLLPHTTPAEAVKTAIRIRAKVATLAVRSGSYQHRPTVSIGIDTFDGRSTLTPEELRRRANKALHEAKRRGKDQVWLYSDAPSQQQSSSTAGDREASAGETNTGPAST